jgi:hypothetical protein
MMTRVVNINSESYDVYIGRGSKWGNPYRIGIDGTRDEVIAKFRRYIMNHMSLMNSLYELEGKVLGCHCKPEACHGDVLVSLLDDLSTFI